MKLIAISTHSSEGKGKSREPPPRVSLPTRRLTFLKANFVISSALMQTSAQEERGAGTAGTVTKTPF